MSKKHIWKVVSTDLSYGIECSNCKHKMDAKEVIMADKEYDICPFCGASMDLGGFNYDEICSLIS